jgi:hypothetical protein
MWSKKTGKACEDISAWMHSNTKKDPSWAFPSLRAWKIRKTRRNLAEEHVELGY